MEMILCGAVSEQQAGEAAAGFNAAAPQLQIRTIIAPS